MSLVTIENSLAKFYSEMNKKESKLISIVQNNQVIEMENLTEFIY